MDPVGPQRIDGQRCHDGRIDTARKADRGLLVAVLAEKVAESAAGRLVDQAGALIIRRRDRDGRSLDLRIENAEILLEALQHQHHLAPGVHRTRGAVIDDLRRTADLVDHHKVLALDKGQVAHHFVAIGHRSLAVTARIDRKDRLDGLVEITFAAQIVADNHGALVSLDRNVLEALRWGEETHLPAGRNVPLADISLDLAVLDQGGGADRTFVRQHRKPHERRDAAAGGGDLLQSLLAQLEEGGLAKQIEARSSAHGLLGEDHQIGPQGFCPIHRIDDLGGIAVDITDRIVQLGYGYFHVSNLSRLL